MSRSISMLGLVLGLFVFGGPGVLRADVYTVVSGTGAVNLDVPTSGTFDINGSAAFADPNFVSDPVIAIDPSFLTHPGNELLFATNFPVNEFASMIFNLGGASVTASGLVVPGLFTAVTSPGCAGGAFAGCLPVTDPALIGILGDVQFNFSVPTRNANGLSFQLQSITTVPEPGGFVFTGLGVMALVITRLCQLMLRRAQH